MLSSYDAWLQKPYYDDEADEKSYEEWLCEEADNRYHSERETGELCYETEEN